MLSGSVTRLNVLLVAACVEVSEIHLLLQVEFIDAMISPGLACLFVVIWRTTVVADGDTTGHDAQKHPCLTLYKCHSMHMVQAGVEELIISACCLLFAFTIAG